MSRPARPKFSIITLEDRVVPAVALDRTFGTDGKAIFNLGSDDHIAAVAVQPDGKIVVAGDTDDSSATGGDFLVARLNANGTLDTTFGANGVRTIDFGGRDTLVGLSLMADCRIVVAGTNYKTIGTNVTQAVPAVARLNANGSDDTTFAGTGHRTLDSGSVSAVAATATGQVLIADGSGGKLNVTRLDPAGAPDAAFGKSGLMTLDLAGTDYRVVINISALDVLTDGRPVVSGTISQSLAIAVVPPGGTSAPLPPLPPLGFLSMRLSASGVSEDYGFGNVLLNGHKAAVVTLDGFQTAATSAVLRQDGTVWIAGTTTGTSNTADFAVAKITPYGLPDAGFQGTGKRIMDLGGVDVANALSVGPDGKIVMAGSTGPQGGDTNLAIVRLNADGSDDGTFGGPKQFDLGGADDARAAALSSDGRVIVAGSNGPASASHSAVVALADQKSDVVLVSGAPDAKALQYFRSNGQFVLGPAFAGFDKYTGSVRVASLDITGDGAPERIVAAGPGGSPWVAVFDGKTGQAIGGFYAFEPTFTGGLLLAGGDFNGDGRADLVIAADVGGGPRVRIFDGKTVASQNPAVIADFFGIEDVNFRGGARPTVGDINGDGVPDLIVAAGPGGGPRVAIFDGKQIAAGAAKPGRLMADFFAFEPGLRNGAFPSAGDVDGDGFADLVFGAGPGGAPRVLVVGGKQLLSAGPISTIDQTPGLGMASFFAGDPNSRSGLSVLARDTDGDGRADIMTGSGPGMHSEMRIYSSGKALSADPQPDQTFDPFGGTVAGGVFVG